MASDQFSGGCLCGAIRYRIDGKPRETAFCHCATCRRATGAPVTAWAVFDTSALTFEQGEPVTFNSSPGVERRFCGKCGTPLTYTADFLPGMIDVTVASLDDPTAVAPQSHIWDSQRIPWLRIDDDLPRHQEFPPQP